MINTDSTPTLIVKFAFQSGESQYICKPKDLMAVLKKQTEPRGIEYIKLFDPVKLKFTRISKAQILAYTPWDAEETEFFRKHYYFNK